MLIKIPFKLILNSLEKISKKELTQYLKDNKLLPQNIAFDIYSSEFIKIKNFLKYDKIFVDFLEIEINCDSTNINAKILTKLKQIKESLKKKINYAKIWIKGRNPFFVGWENLKFFAYHMNIALNGFVQDEIEVELLMRGRINQSVVNKFKKENLQIIEDELNLLGSGPIDSDKQSLKELKKELAPNFIFIRSLLDFINSAPSDSFSNAFFDLSKKYSFLFRPQDKFWVDLSKMQEKKQIKLLFPLLNRTRGLTRVKFDDFARYWRNMIMFLNSNCQNTASNFFLNCCKKLQINPKEPEALEKLQSILEKFSEIKLYAGIKFPYSYKAGRLMFTMMTKNRRGFDLLKGVNKAHLQNFNLPVDSQVLRVALNTGLVKIDFVKTKLKKKEKNNQTVSAYVLSLKRSDMTEIVQKAWKLVSKKMNVSQTELDYFIYSIGSLVCNRFGQNCYCCPITSKCQSWSKKKVFEGSGVNWYKYGGFSYAKGEDDALFFRTCDGSGDPDSCKSSFYKIPVFEISQSKLDLKSLKEKYKK